MMLRVSLRIFGYGSLYMSLRKVLFETREGTANMQRGESPQGT